MEILLDPDHVRSAVAPPKHTQERLVLTADEPAAVWFAHLRVAWRLLYMTSRAAPAESTGPLELGAVRPVSLRALQAFLLVAELDSFRRAGEHLFMDASTISKLVRRLEAELGVELLHRSTRTVTLTAAGEAAREAALTLLLATCQLRDAVGPARPRPGGPAR
jgi:DNA-binding MarR family transcriptional regulator